MSTIDTKANYRKDTRFSRLSNFYRLSKDVDGRAGVYSYAGHFTPHGVGVHMRAENEPDRPQVLLLDRESALELRRLLDAYLAL